MIPVEEQPHIAGEAFDAIAESYDQLFTTSAIGRSQRAVVWQQAGATFRPGDHILELNCGTGEDALFLAARGISVTACDASARMIERAHMRKAAEAPSANAAFHLLSTESLHQLPSRLRFDGVFSNFSGLNCVKDLAALAENLALRLEAGAPLVLCFSTRFCIWEILHYLFRANPDKAFRRCRGSSEAHLGDRSFPVYYRTVRSILKSLRPMFRLRSVTGIGIAVPPSYMEHWARKHSRLLRICEAADRVLCRCPAFRVLGDHMLLHLERV